MTRVKALTALRGVVGITLALSLLLLLMRLSHLPGYHALVIGRRIAGSQWMMRVVDHMKNSR